MSKVENKAAISAINSFFSSRAFTTYRTAGEGQAISATPLYHFYPSQTLRHSPGNYCGDLASAHIQQPDSNREPLVSERKSLTTKEAGAYNFTKSKNSSTGAFHIFKTTNRAEHHICIQIQIKFNPICHRTKNSCFQQMGLQNQKDFR